MMGTGGTIKVTVDGRKYHITGLKRTDSYKNLLCALAKSKSYSLDGGGGGSGGDDGDILETMKRDCLRVGDDQSFQALNSLGHDAKIFYRRSDDSKTDSTPDSNRRDRRRGRGRPRKTKETTVETEASICVNVSETEVSTSEKDTTTYSNRSRSTKTQTMKSEQAIAPRNNNQNTQISSKRRKQRRCGKSRNDSDPDSVLARAVSTRFDQHRSQQRTALKSGWVRELRRTSQVYFVDDDACRCDGDKCRCNKSTRAELPECDRRQCVVGFVGDMESSEGNDSGLHSFDYDTSSLSTRDSQELDENSNPINKTALCSTPQLFNKEFETEEEESNKSSKRNGSRVKAAATGGDLFSTRVNEIPPDNNQDATGGPVSENKRRVRYHNGPLCDDPANNTRGDRITCSNSADECSNDSTGLRSEALDAIETLSKQVSATITESGVNESDNSRQVEHIEEGGRICLPDTVASPSPVASVTDLRNTVINDVAITVDASLEDCRRQNTDLDARDGKMMMIDAAFIGRTTAKPSAVTPSTTVDVSTKSSTPLKPVGDAKKKLRKIDISQPSLLDAKSFTQFDESCLLDAGGADEVTMTTNELPFKSAGKKLRSSFRRKKNTNDVELTPADKLPPLPNGCTTPIANDAQQNGLTSTEHVTSTDDVTKTNGEVTKSDVTPVSEKKRRGRSKSPMGRKKDRVKSPTRVTSPIRKLSNLIRKNHRKNDVDSDVSSSSAASSNAPSIRNSIEDFCDGGSASSPGMETSSITSGSVDTETTCGNDADTESHDRLNGEVTTVETGDQSSTTRTVNNDNQTVSEESVDFSSYLSPSATKTPPSPELEHTPNLKNVTRPRLPPEKGQMSMDLALRVNTTNDVISDLPTPLGEFSSSKFGETSAKLSIEDLELENDEALSFFDNLLADLESLDFTPTSTTASRRNCTSASSETQNVTPCVGNTTPGAVVDRSATPVPTPDCNAINAMPIKSILSHNKPIQRTLFPDEVTDSKEYERRTETPTNDGESRFDSNVIAMSHEAERVQLLREYELTVGSIGDLQDRIDHVGEQMSGASTDWSEKELLAEEESVYNELQSVKNLLASVIDLTSYQYQEITRNLECMAELDEEIRTRFSQLNSVQGGTCPPSREEMTPSSRVEIIRKSRDEDTRQSRDNTVPNRDSIPRSLLKRRGGPKEKVARKGWTDGQVDDRAMVGRYL